MKSQSTLHREMALLIRDMMGDGYIDDFYWDLAREFTQVAIAFGAKEEDGNG